MKNIFGVFKDPDANNYSKFIIRKLSDVNKNIFDNLSNEGKDIEKKNAPYQWLLIASLFATVVGLLFMVLILLAKDGFEHALKDRGYFFYIGIGLFVLGLPAHIFLRIKYKNLKTSPEISNFVNKVNIAVKECEFELKIPETAIKMDILFVSLKKDKNGEEKLNPIPLVPYINQELKVFIEKDFLCFADHFMVIGIPLDSIKGIKTINKRISFSNWNKKEQYNSPTYRQYNLSKNRFDAIFVNHIMKLILI